MSGPVEFLIAQLDEDERHARFVDADNPDQPDTSTFGGSG
jgi:hypothetical protein